MKHILILTALLLSGCSSFSPSIEDKTAQEIVTEIQSEGAFSYGILTFSCEQMFVVEA